MTTTTFRDQTQLVVDPAVPAIQIIREFEAPVERVFRAWIDPELVVRWLGPRRLIMKINTWDLRRGGSYNYVHVDADGTEFGFYGSVHDVRQNERIVQTFTFDGYPDGISVDTAEFQDLGDGRTRVVISSFTDSFEARDGMVASGMAEGVVQGHERLDDLLASQA